MLALLEAKAKLFITDNKTSEDKIALYSAAKQVSEGLFIKILTKEGELKAHDYLDSSILFYAIEGRNKKND